MSRFSENTIEQAALGWLEAIDYDVRRGADILRAIRRPVWRSK